MKLSTQTKTSFLYHSGAKQPPKCCINALAVVLFYNYNFVDSLEFFTKVGLKKQNVTFAFCFFRKIWLKGVESWKQFVITHHDLRYRSLNLGKKMETTTKFNSFLVNCPCYLSCIKDIFTIAESWKTKNVTWSFFLLLKLALLSPKMKIQNHTILVHNERFLAPKNSSFCVKL